MAIDWGEGDPLVSRDSQEALSRRYGSAVVSILPLASGRLAVIGLERSLLGFCDSLEEAVEMSSAHWLEVEASWAARKKAPSPPVLVSNKTVDDLF